MQRRAFLVSTAAATLAACSGGESQDEGPGDELGATSTEGPTTSTTAVPAAPQPRSQPHQAGTPSRPFATGVASGDPTPDGITLWTRLIGEEDASLAMGDPEVEFEIATDPDFTELAASGTTNALQRAAHTARVTVTGLPPGLLYYRFRWQGSDSIIGRTRTTQPLDDRPYRVALMSCQHYEEGWFVAHRGLVEDQPDLVIHVGDYIYGRRGAGALVRQQPLDDPRDLGDYRSLYTAYRRDPDLIALHAAAPLSTVWDDHEVIQNDVGTVPDDRRQWAYRAWWEQQAAALPEVADDGTLPIHRRLDIDGLARLWLLDGRQYRSPQVCERLDVLPAIDRCDDIDDPTRTMLGADQEAWLDRGVTADGRWDLVAQQTVLADMSLSIGGVTGINHDQWDGYAPARERLLTTLGHNPRSVVLSGDIHAAMVNVVEGDGGTVGEIVAPSATTRMNSTLARGLRLGLGLKSTVRTFEPDVHGYTLLDISPSQVGVTLRGVDPADPLSTPSTVGQWVIDADAPLPRAL